MRGKILTIRLLVFIISLLLSSYTYILNCQTKPYPKPGWVEKVFPDTSLTNLDTDSYGGYYYLLVDVQENLPEEAIYCHYIVKLFNSNGVQDMSDISVDYDPTYQKLAYHEINRYRNGVKTNELSNHSFKTIQRESEMNRFLYDGRLTTYINLEDVREGDILEYSFTLRGYNPINKGHYYKSINLEYNDPVRLIYRRITSLKNTKLYFQYPSGNVEPEIQESNNTTIYTWKANEVKAHIYDNNVPSWYNDNLRIELSTIRTWNELVKVCIGDYKLNDKEKAIVKSTAHNLFGIQYNDSTLISIIRFVQDEIRYLGFESGLNAYKPALPSVVFKSRFADCKAKSLLLCSLLQVYGVESYPVFVNSNGIQSDSTILPSRDVFNHVVVQVVLKENTFYIDPTLSNQGGDISNYFFPHYGLGLVLSEDSPGLTSLTNGCISETKVSSYISIDSIGKPGILKVITEYSGLYADDIRSSYKESSIDETSKSYLKFYSNTYPLIRNKEPLKYRDDRKKNIFIVEEEYLIDSLWKPVQGNSDKIRMTTGALIIRSAVSIPASPERTMPYSISYPSNLTEDVYIDLPTDWNITPETVEINDSVFSFLYSADYKDKRIHLHYTYKTLSDHKEAIDFKEFYSSHEKISDNLLYSLTYTDNESKPFNISWIIVIIYLFVLAAGIGLAIVTYKYYNLPATSSVSENISGWLIVVALGLIVSTFKVASSLFFEGDFFDHETWLTIINSDNRIPLFILVSLEFLYNSVLFTYLILLQILFYKKRNIFPRLVILFYSVNTVVLILDTFFAHYVTPDSFSIEEKNKSYLEIGQSILYSIIWITYILKSERVKNTFVEVSQKPSDKIIHFDKT